MNLRGQYTCETKGCSPNNPIWDDFCPVQVVVKNQRNNKTTYRHGRAGAELWLFLICVAELELRLYSDQEEILLDELCGSPHYGAFESEVYYDLGVYSAFNTNLNLLSNMEPDWTQHVQDFVQGGSGLQEAIATVVALRGY